MKMADYVVFCYGLVRVLEYVFDRITKMPLKMNS